MKASQYSTILGTIWIAEGSTFGFVAAALFLLIATYHLYLEWK